MTHLSPLLVGAAMALVSAPIAAQLGKVLSEPINVQTPTGNGRCLGVCRTDLGGQERFWVSAGAVPASAGNTHKFFEFDRKGTLLNTYVQPTNPYTTGQFEWGMRDLAYDGRYIYGGDETNIGYAFDLVTKAFDSSKNITGPAGLTVMRALAYDPVSDTFWTSNFGGVVFNFKRDGTIVWSGQSGAVSMYGAAYDRGRNRLWWLGQAGSTRPGTGVVGSEFNPVTMGATGTEFIGDPWTGGIAGGMDYYVLNNVPTLLCLAQADVDTIYELGGTFVYGTSCAGGSGKVPEVGMAGDSPWQGNAIWEVTVSDATGATAGLLFLGRNKTVYSGLPLPFALDPIGLTNCKILAALDIPVGVAAVNGGFANMIFPIPKILALRHAETYWQWLVIDPTATNPLRITFSTGGQTVLY